MFVEVGMFNHLDGLVYIGLSDILEEIHITQHGTVLVLDVDTAEEFAKLLLDFCKKRHQ